MSLAAHRSMLQHGRTDDARTLMARAHAERFAVGAFNADNLETMRAICRAACTMNVPVLIELSHAEVSVIGLHNARAIVDNEIAELGIDAYLNLDHAPKVDAARAAVDAGFEFVHLDAFRGDPHASDDVVVEATLEIVEYARRTGAVVEGEHRYLRGSSTLHREHIDSAAVAASLSTPDEVRAFVDATGIDTCAIDIGNVHGRYPDRKRLDLELLRRIRAVVDVNLSVHGASGISERLYGAVARVGVQKINVNSDIRYAYRGSLSRQLATYPDELSTAKLVPPVISAVQRVIENKIHAFGSAGNARRRTPR